MGNYDDIGLPVKGQPISSGAFGIKVRNYIIDADRRLSTVENSLLPRYYIKANATSRANTVTPSADTGTGQILAGIPLEIGSYEIEFVGLWNTSTTGTQGIRSRWGFTGTATTLYYRNCLGTGDNATAPNVNATIMALASPSLSNDANYFTGTTGGFVCFREICTGFIVTAAGNLSYNWSQSVTSANNTNLQAGSYFRITRYA